MSCLGMPGRLKPNRVCCQCTQAHIHHTRLLFAANQPPLAHSRYRQLHNDDRTSCLPSSAAPLLLQALSNCPAAAVAPS